MSPVLPKREMHLDRGVTNQYGCNGIARMAAEMQALIQQLRLEKFPAGRASDATIIYKSRAMAAHA